MKVAASAPHNSVKPSLRKWGELGQYRWATILGAIFFSWILPAGLRGQDSSGRQPTFKVGNVPITVTGSFEAEFNDNINYSNDNRASDIILRPGIVLGINYRFSELNTVSVKVGASWDEYLFHSNLSTYTNFAEVSPDSQLQFTFKLADTTTLTLYDSFNYSVEPNDALSRNPNTGAVITNIQAFGRFMNQIGGKLEYEMTQNTLINVGAYRYDVFPQDALYNFLRRWQYTGTASINQVIGAYTVGLEGSYSWNYYSTNLENNSTSWYVAPSLKWIGEKMTLRATVGFTGYHFDNNGTNGDSSQPNTYVGEIDVTVPLSKNMDDDFGVSRSSNYGYVTNTIVVDRITEKIGYKEFLFKAMTGSLQMYYEEGRESGGSDPEHYRKFVISPSVEYAFTKRFTMYGSYEFADKFSNLSARTYQRDQVIIGLRYDF